MKDPLKTGFSDRIANAAEAKKAMLEKFKPKPTVVPTEFVDRNTLREQEREAVRKERAEAKEAQRLAQLAAEEAALAEKRSQRKERKALTAAEQKAKRDARYAARMAAADLLRRPRNLGRFGPLP